MNSNGSIGPRGELTLVVERGNKPPLYWRVRNALIPGHMRSTVGVALAKGFSKLSGAVTLTSELAVIHFHMQDEVLQRRWLELKTGGADLDALRAFSRNFGRIQDYGIVSRRVVTDAGVAYLVDDWDNSATDITNMNFHGVGTGTNAEAAGDTTLQTESTTILNPDSTRATGTKSQPAANQLRTVGTVLFDGAGAITEHGIFSQAATGGGTLWDRSVFGAINVVSADSIQATYTCTINSGS